MRNVQLMALLAFDPIFGSVISNKFYNQHYHIDIEQFRTSEKLNSRVILWFYGSNFGKYVVIIGGVQTLEIQLIFWRPINITVH